MHVAEITRLCTYVEIHRPLSIIKNQIGKDAIIYFIYIRISSPARPQTTRLLHAACSMRAGVGSRDTFSLEGEHAEMKLRSSVAALGENRHPSYCTIMRRVGYLANPSYYVIAHLTPKRRE